MYDIVSIGECLIDFTPFKEQPNGYPVFEQNPGGAPANMVASAAARGARVSYIGLVGDDQFGRFLSQQLQKANIDTRGMSFSPTHHTTLAFVHLDDDGQREFNFNRDADIMLAESDVDWELVRSTKLLHVSSLVFDGPIAAATAHKVTAEAKKAGALISYDVNWRPMLWKDLEAGKASIKQGIDAADILKVSEEELVLVTDIEDEVEAVASLHARGVKMVVVTKGGDGTIVYTKHASAACAARKGLKVIDTTGAGDACFGAFVWEYLASGKDIDALNADDLYAFQRVANAVAGLTVTVRGGISSIPTAEAVAALLAE